MRQGERFGVIFCSARRGEKMETSTIGIAKCRLVFARIFLSKRQVQNSANYYMYYLHMSILDILCIII